jgi:hypothetical protein
MQEIVEILESEGDKLSCRNTVLQLCANGVTDYDRGRIQGQIEMLTKIMQRLASNEED